MLACHSKHLLLVLNVVTCTHAAADLTKEEEPEILCFLADGPGCKQSANLFSANKESFLFATFGCIF